MSVETVGLDQLRAHVRVTGDLDLSTGAALWAVLRSHLAAGRRCLRLDLSGVGFLDATALAGMAEIHRAALSRRGTLILTGVAGRVARLLQLSGLDQMLFISGPRPDDDIAGLEPVSEHPVEPIVWPASAVPRGPGNRAATT